VGFFVYFQLIRHVFHLALYLGYAGGFSFDSFVCPAFFVPFTFFDVTGCTLCFVAIALS